MKRDVAYILIIVLLVGFVWAWSPRNRTVNRTRLEETPATNKESSDPPANHSLPRNFARIDGYIKRPGFPIRYDESLGEYQLIYSHLEGTNQVESHMPLKYCPWTGQAFPKSKRGDLFMEV